MKLGFSTLCAVITGMSTLLLISAGAYFEQGKVWTGLQLLGVSFLTGWCTVINWQLGED